MYNNDVQVRKINILSMVECTGGFMKKALTAEEYLNRVMTTEVSDNCPMRRTLELLSGKWRTHIIYELC